jgi:hypothetical protein
MIKLRNAALYKKMDTLEHQFGADEGIDMSGAHRTAMRDLLQTFEPYYESTYRCMKLETNSTPFSDFLHHPNCLASGRVHTLLTERKPDSFVRLIRDLITLYEIEYERGLPVALCSNSIVTEYSPLLPDFGRPERELSDLVFDLYVEPDPLRWLAVLAQAAVGRDIQEVFVDLCAYSDCTKEMLKYVVEFTSGEYLTQQLSRARAVMSTRLA